MSNVECGVSRTHHLVVGLGIRHFDFVILSSFVIRKFVIGQASNSNHAASAN